MDSQMKLKNYIEGALMAALAAMIALIGFYIPPFQVITVFVWLVPIIVVAVRRDFYTGILALITSAILLMILATPWRAFIFIVQFAGLGVVFSYYFSKRAEFSKIIMMGTIVVAISTVISFLLSFLIMGFSIADLTAAFEETTDSVIIMYESMGVLDRLQEQGLTIEEIRNTIMSMSNLLVKLIPATMVIYGMTVAFITYFITRKVLQKLTIQVSQLPMFRYWQIPWYFIWGVIVGLALLLYGDFRSWEVGSIIGMNIMYMYFPILFIQGLSVLAFYYNKWKISILLKVLLLVIIVLNIPLTLMVLLITGLFDPLFNYRKIGYMKEKNNKEKG
ncbi:MAG: hypothetical protein APF76_02135 [Desulfitibacter sp. BRH_c19]|nr:MAG: hypothetical protein APF76_02135 [Desulfitibacter sp. BRH_c19]